MKSMYQYINVIIHLTEIAVYCFMVLYVKYKRTYVCFHDATDVLVVRVGLVIKIRRCIRLLNCIVEYNNKKAFNLFGAKYTDT